MKNIPKSRAFSIIFRENWIKRFVAEPEVNIETDEMLSFIRGNTLEAVFQVMRVVLIRRKGQKRLKKIDLYLKGTLAWPLIYDQAYNENLWTAL